MKKTFITLCLFTAVGSIKAQQITTPSNTPLSIQTYVDVVGGLNIKKDSSFKISGKSVLSTKGTGNVIVGEDAGNYSLTNPAATGTYNLLLGGNAGYTNLSGAQNTCIGFNSGFNNRTGSFNLFLGTSSGLNTNSASANGNVFIGVNSGTDNVTGSNNTVIGTNSTLGGQTGLTYATAIGADASVTQSNSIVLGKSGTSVGIGNTAPTAKLHITSGVANTSGLRLENLTSATPAQAGGSGKALSVDVNGNVILVGITGPGVGTTSVGGGPVAENWKEADGYLYNNSTNGVVIKGTGLDGNSLIVKGGVLSKEVNVKIEGSESWPDYVFKPNYKRMTLGEVEKFISINGHLPNVPSATEMAATGNNLGQTDVKLLEKVEELTLYLLDMKKANDSQAAELKALKQQVSKLRKK
jgi:trimeric autotransporter adhesin